MSDGTTRTYALTEYAADIIAAYVGNNSVARADLPGLIASVHSALSNAMAGVQSAPVEPEKLVPAISIRRSITPDYLICLEDGKKFKSLKRHLQSKYGLSPQDYRTKWGLPSDYPMVAPNYAAARSNLAKQMGLGQQRRKPVAKRGRKPAAR